MRMFLFLLLVQFVSTASASRTDSILTILDSELGKKMEYRMEKEKQISTLKQSLFVASSVYEQYFICDKLYIPAHFQKSAGRCTILRCPAPRDDGAHRSG